MKHLQMENARQDDIVHGAERCSHDCGYQVELWDPDGYVSDEDGRAETVNRSEKLERKADWLNLLGLSVAARGSMRKKTLAWK